MIERRKKIRGEYLTRLEKEIIVKGYDDNDLYNICELIKLDLWTDFLLDESQRWLKYERKR